MWNGEAPEMVVSLFLASPRLPVTKQRRQGQTYAAKVRPLRTGKRHVDAWRQPSSPLNWLLLLPAYWFRTLPSSLTDVYYFSRENSHFLDVSPCATTLGFPKTAVV
jgi:hypothetical protein